MEKAERKKIIDVITYFDFLGLEQKLNGKCQGLRRKCDQEQEGST